MWPMFVRWTLRVGLGSILLLTLLLVPLAATVSSAELPSPPTNVPDLLDINTATAEQLKTLPGIGDAHAEKMIQGRPYARKEELVEKNILSRGKYEGIKYKIVTKQK